MSTLSRGKDSREEVPSGVLGWGALGRDVRKWAGEDIDVGRLEKRPSAFDQRMEIESRVTNSPENELNGSSCVLILEFFTSHSKGLHATNARDLLAQYLAIIFIGVSIHVIICFGDVLRSVDWFGPVGTTWTIDS